MSTISSIQNQPAVAETTYCGSCSQFLYDIVNKVKEVFLAILQTILPCFFPSATIDQNVVNQLAPASTNPPAPLTPAQAVQQVQGVQGQLGQQAAPQASVGSGGTTQQLPSIPSGGQPSADGTSGVPTLNQRMATLGQPLPGLTPGAPELPVLRAASDAGVPLQQPNASGSGQSEPPGGLHSPAAPHEPEYLLPFQGEDVIPLGSEYNAGGQADLPAADPALSPNAEFVMVPPANLPGAEQANSLVGDGNASFATLTEQGLPVTLSYDPSSAFRPPAPSLGAIIFPRDLLAPLQWHVPPSSAAAAPATVLAVGDDNNDEQMDGGASPAGVTPRRETLHAPAGGSLPHDDNDGSGAGSFAAALLPSAFAAAVPSNSVTVMEPLTSEFPGSNPSNPSDTTDVSDASSDALLRAALLTRRLKALRSGQISASQVTDPTDVDDGKEADDFRSQVHQTQRAVIIQQGSGEEPAGFFAACAMAIDWERDFNEVIPESSEFDETLTQAKTKFNKSREEDLVEIAQNGGMQLDNLGLHRSRHAWVDALRAIAATRQRPIVAILTNDAYSMSYAVRIAKQGSEYVCHLFSPNAHWNPAESDPIYQSFTKLDDLKGALPRTIRKYSAYELTGVAKYQHSHGTGSSDEFAAVAAAASLPASGVLVEAAPNPDEQS